MVESNFTWAKTPFKKVSDRRGALNGNIHNQYIFNCNDRVQIEVPDLVEDIEENPYWNYIHNLIYGP